MAALGIPAHAPARRRLRLATAVVAGALASACGVTEREDLVGRYETEGRRERWTLAADGTCERTHVGADGRTESSRCEWQWSDRDGSRKLIVTLLPPDGAPGRDGHHTRYVLAPSRSPGGPVTIPLGADGAELRKVE